MDFRSKQIAPPRDWATFEDLCLAIFRAEWNDSLTLKNGRTGQPQHGVDVYGAPQRGHLYGVQCKGKSRNYGAKATVGELEAELAKAENFEPALTHWIFATSASKDERLQTAARVLSTERQAKGQFPVTALGWEDIQTILAGHPNVIEDFYPEHAYDITGLLKALRELPTGEEVRELRDHLKQLNEAQRSTLVGSPHPSWNSVSFSGQRDLGPALLGRGLGPADANACPRLQEADMIVAQLRRAFSARLVGAPGSGKSVCAYQAANDFAAAGWNIRRMRDASAVTDPSTLPDEDLCLLLIDDAHLMSQPILRQIEDTANARRLVLSIHNDTENGPVNRGAVVIDAKRAVRTIAAELQRHLAQTLAAVRRADSDVGIKFLDVPLERRIDEAATHSDRPWQFCFILGGGWKRAKEAADAARAANADLVLAATGILQLASRDAPRPAGQVRDFCAENGISSEKTTRAISWLSAQRLLLSESDCRCPHQRFALVVLGSILEGQDDKGRALVGEMLNRVVSNASFPIAGLGLLLHELRFFGSYRRWTNLVRPEALEMLIKRCWNVESANERNSAAFLFSDLDGYLDNWHERIHEQYIPTIAEWITTARPPTAHGLKSLVNGMWRDHSHTIAEIAKMVSPEAIAHTVSRVTPDTAAHCASLIKSIGWQRSDCWNDIFKRTFRREAALTLARTWPSSAPLYDFAYFCESINAWDDELGLEMVDAFTPTAQKAFVDDPVSAFRKLGDILDHVLRLSDPLGVYVGKHAPNQRRFALGKQMCATLKPRLLATQLSNTQQRDFQNATFFLSFLRKASNSKFKATVEAIDWPRIANIIGDEWSNLSHQAEIFLTVSYSSKRARTLIAETVAQNLNRIEKFSPRLAVMMPEIAVRHIDAGKQVRLGQHDHFEFRFGAIFIAQLKQLRPDLIETVVSPFESLAAKVLSQTNSSWFRNAPKFIAVLAEVAPDSLQRILSAIDTKKAEQGWIDSLRKSGPAQDAVALLVESALSRGDAVGDMARRLRKKYRKGSTLKKRKNWRED